MASVTFDVSDLAAVHDFRVLLFTLSHRLTRLASVSSARVVRFPRRGSEVSSTMAHRL